MLQKFFRELACWATLGHAWNTFHAIGPAGEYIERRCRGCGKVVVFKRAAR